MYDIAIIGAGPAGATLARLLGKQFRVLLLERSGSKCCAGILAPDAQRMLSRLGLAVPKAVLADPQPFAVAVLDTTSKLIRRYSRQYININRSDFDDWLRSLIPDSVDFRRETTYRCSEPLPEQSPGWTIQFKQQGELQTEQARWIIGADGAYSMVRREFFAAPPRLKHYIALQDWFDFEEIDATNEPVDFRNDYVGVFDPEFSDFYAWTVPKNDSLIVGGATSLGSGNRERFEAFKKRLEPFGLRLGRSQRREACQLLRPMSGRAVCLGSDRIALVGEAAGLISPSSAEGISFALAGAKMLAESFDASGFQPSLYRKKARTLLWSITMKNLKSPGMFNPWLRRQVMSSGLTALKD